MTRVGRNEPCPCGSGKKYKQCCMPKDMAVHTRGLSIRRDDALLWARLLAFGQRPAFFVDLHSAFSRFWNGDFDLEASEALQPQQIEVFLEWYAHDYRTGKGRQRIIDLFVAEEGPRLTVEQRELLAEHEAAHLSLYGIEAVQADGRLEVGDLLAGGFYQVEDAGLARLAMPGDLLLGRRLGNEEVGRLSRSTVLLPASLGAGLSAAAKRAFIAYREEHFEAGWPEFLREVGYVMFHYLLTSQAAEAYEEAPQREGYFDPRVAVEGMHAIMRRQAEEQARKEAEEEARQRQENDEPPETGPSVEWTPGGILIPGQPKPGPGGGSGLILPGQVRK